MGLCDPPAFRAQLRKAASRAKCRMAGAEHGCRDYSTTLGAIDRTLLDRAYTGHGARAAALLGDR
jgi:hypothetical protein